jgi:hypothetical protein
MQNVRAGHASNINLARIGTSLRCSVMKYEITEAKTILLNDYNNKYSKYQDVIKTKS